MFLANHVAPSICWRLQQLPIHLIVNLKFGRKSQYHDAIKTFGPLMRDLDSRRSIAKGPATSEWLHLSMASSNEHVRPHTL
jgi:hypothetical protein